MLIRPGPPNALGEVDVVIADESELTRVLESGRADISTAIDLGVLAWPAAEPRRPPRGRWERHVRPARRAGNPMAVAVVVAGAPASGYARRFVAYLKDAATGGECFTTPAKVLTAAPDGPYAAAVVDWWLPQCSLDGNRYNDPREALGPPDAVSLGGKDNYRGFISLGQAGYVTVDMGQAVVDEPGPDLRVYQTVTGEPVTVYAARTSVGPFVLLGLRVPCGTRTPDVFSNHCDFNLEGSGLSEARYFRIEDGEVFPCLKAGSVSEGADLDAVQSLH